MDFKKIEEFAAGIDWYLKQLSSFTAELKEVKVALMDLKKSMERKEAYDISSMKAQIDHLTNELKKKDMSTFNEYEETLGGIRKAMNEGWPLAVPQDRICLDEGQKDKRAKSVINLFVSEYLKDKKFLDFGCGDGRMALAARINEADFVIGYDIKEDWKVGKVGGVDLTTDWTRVKDNAPYDVILVHDVLDHIEIYDPIEVLRMLKDLMTIDGHIYVMNHPWSSRHGGHLYLKNNLAFLHLAMDEVELMRIGGLKPDYSLKVITPIETYRYWFNEAGLKVDSETPIVTEVEEFFKVPNPVSERIVANWEEGVDPFAHMEIDFVEYVLSSGISDHQIL